MADTASSSKKTEQQWREILSTEAFDVTRKAGTERPFANAYWNSETKGNYHCICCDTLLFHSKDKYDSGTGWPSFTRSIAPQAIATREDRGIFRTRTEVLCHSCNAHLGHVFSDGPAPTGQRYCMNSAALNLKPSDK